jgi:hypothetical protein
MDITKLNAKDILEETRFNEYEAGMGFFFSELVELNTIIYLAEAIIEFPFDLFVGSDNTIFFGVVMRSFHNSVIITITRLATDIAGDLHTLPHFKTWVRDSMKPEFKSLFEDRLRTARFDHEVRRLLRKAKGLRDNRIAHTTQDFVSGSVTVYRPSISELRTMRNALNSLLDALSFNVEYIMLPIPYSANITPKRPTDIEEILDCIAKNSHLLNMPERYPERWSKRRAKLEKEDKLTIFNGYRRKFGLSET